MGLLREVEDYLRGHGSPEGVGGYLGGHGSPEGGGGLLKRPWIS